MYPVTESYLEASRNPIFPNGDLLIVANNNSKDFTRMGADPELLFTPFANALIIEYYSIMEANGILYINHHKHYQDVVEQAFNKVKYSYVIAPVEPHIREDIRWSVFGAYNLKYFFEINEDIIIRPSKKYFNLVRPPESESDDEA
jgi:hypothetical protein